MHPAVPRTCAGRCVDLAVVIVLSSWGLLATHVGYICTSTLNSAREHTQGLHLHRL